MSARRRHHRCACITRRRAAALLELIAALAIFVGAGLAILGATRGSLTTAATTRDAEQAADLAASALALLRAGLATPESLHGPVDPAALTSAAGIREGETGAAFDNAPPAPTNWSLHIETEPTDIPGLTLTIVTAELEDHAARVRASATLAGYIRLSPAAAPETAR